MKNDAAAPLLIDADVWQMVSACHLSSFAVPPSSEQGRRDLERTFEAFPPLLDTVQHQPSARLQAEPTVFED